MLNTIKQMGFIGLMLWQATTQAYGQEEATKLSSAEAYEYGHIVLQTKDWRDAIIAFKQAAKDKNLKSAAMYWQAYSHYQLKQKAQAKRLLKRLIKSEPQSEWVDDAEMLLFEHGDGDEKALHQDQLDEELKLFTLQQIMFNNPEKALPKIYTIIEQSNSIRVKLNAIHILGLSEQPEVVDYLIRLLEKETNIELQQQAIQMLSLREDKDARNKLAHLYQTSKNKEIKIAIIQGFIHQQDSKQLIAMLNQEQDPELSMYLIQMLGIKGETVALKNIYKKSQGDQRRAILEALALSGDATYLYDVIEHEKDTEIRLQAIHSLIMVNDEHMGDYLFNLYQQATSSEERDVIANVFIATDIDPALIVRLMKSEDNTERKHSLLNTLMVLGAVEEMKEVYRSEHNPDTQQAIIRLLGVMNAGDVLMEIYQTDPSVLNNQVFFEAVGMTSGSVNEEFLIERFKAGNLRVKEAVLNALMMQDNVEAMVGLLKTEEDREVKKKIIKMIGAVDAEALLDTIEDQ